jgi:hypothetical protein
LFTWFCHKIAYISITQVLLSRQNQASSEYETKKSKTKRLNDQAFVDQQAFWFAGKLSLLYT